jgi:hypothetical protein
MTIGLRSLGLALVVAMLTGCGSREINVYRVAKTAEQPQPATQPAHAPHSVAQAHQAPIQWQLPKGWEQLPPGEMRVGDFRIRGTNSALAEMMITPLAGRAGSDLANVNRWRGQVGLAPISEEQLVTNSESVEIGRESARLFDMTGVSGDDEKTRILAVIYRRGETSWFFKMLGNAALVENEKGTFKEFLKAVSFSDVATASAAN